MVIAGEFDLKHNFDTFGKFPLYCFFILEFMITNYY